MVLKVPPRRAAATGLIDLDIPGAMIMEQGVDHHGIEKSMIFRTRTLRAIVQMRAAPTGPAAVLQFVSTAKVAASAPAPAMIIDHTINTCFLQAILLMTTSLTAQNR